MKNPFVILYPIAIAAIIHISCNQKTNLSRDETNIRKAYAALEKKDFATFASLCSDDYRELGLSPQPIQGIQACIAQYKVFLDAFPDTKFEIQSITPAGKNRYFLQIHMTGTNTEKFLMLPPNGKSYDALDVDIIELNDAGKCISHWSANADAPLDQIGYSAINNPTTGIAMSAYEYFGKGTINALLELCSNDVVFEINDRTLDTKPRWFKGKEEVAKFFIELNSKIVYSKFEPVRFLADGDDLATSVDVEFVQTATKKKFKGNYAHRFKTKDGKLIYFKGMDDMCELIP